MRSIQSGQMRWPSTCKDDSSHQFISNSGFLLQRHGSNTHSICLGLCRMLVLFRAMVRASGAISQHKLTAPWAHALRGVWIPNSPVSQTQLDRPNFRISFVRTPRSNLPSKRVGWDSGGSPVDWMQCKDVPWGSKSGMGTLSFGCRILPFKVLVEARGHHFKASGYRWQAVLRAVPTEGSEEAGRFASRDEMRPGMASSNSCRHNNGLICNCLRHQYPRREVY